MLEKFVILMYLEIEVNIEKIGQPTDAHYICPISVSLV